LTQFPYLCIARMIEKMGEELSSQSVIFHCNPNCPKCCLWIDGDYAR